MLVQMLENLISKKYYKTKEEIVNKLNVFYAMSQITDEDYSSLILKAEETYKEEVTQDVEVEK